MALYHIKNNGEPGICRAKNQSSCPLNKDGSNYHSVNKEDMIFESERRFEEESQPETKISTTANREKFIEELNKKIKIIDSKIDKYGLITKIKINEDEIINELIREYGKENNYLIDTYNFNENHIFNTGKEKHVYSLRSGKLEFRGRLHKDFNSKPGQAGEHSFYKGRAYGYATVDYKDYGEITYPVKAFEGEPANVPAWDFIDLDKIPKEFFEDKTIKSALRRAS